MIKAQHYAEPFVTFDDSALRAQNYRSFSGFLFFTLRGCTQGPIDRRTMREAQIKIKLAEVEPGN